jgi:hypothetical protein
MFQITYLCPLFPDNGSAPIKIFPCTRGIFAGLPTKLCYNCFLLFNRVMGYHLSLDDAIDIVVTMRDSVFGLCVAILISVYLFFYRYRSSPSHSHSNGTSLLNSLRARVHPHNAHGHARACRYQICHAGAGWLLAIRLNGGLPAVCGARPGERVLTMLHVTACEAGTCELIFMELLCLQILGDAGRRSCVYKSKCGGSQVS